MQTERDEFRQFFAAHPQPMLVYETASLRILAANDAALAEYGYSRDELLAMDLLALHPPEDRAEMERAIEPLRSGALRGFHKIARPGMRHLRKDGTAFEIETAGQALVFGGQDARVILVRDVSDRRRVRVLQDRYEALFEKARDIVLFLAPDGRILDANRAAQRTYGYTLEELTKLRISDLRDPGTAADVRRQLAHAEEEGVLFETVHRRRDGAPFPAEVSSTGVEIGGGRVLLSLIRDVSERRKAQAELRRSEARFRLLVERNPEGVALCRDGRFLYLNPALAAWLGSETPGQFVGTPALERFSPADSGELGGRLSARPGDADAPEREMTLLRADGGRLPVAVAAHAVEVEGEAASLLLVREVGGSLHPPPPPPKALREELRGQVEAAQAGLDNARALWKRGPSGLGLSPKEAAARIAEALDGAIAELRRLREKLGE